MSHLMALAGLFQAYDEGGTRALQDMGISPAAIAKIEEIDLVGAQIEELLQNDPHGEREQLQVYRGDLGQELDREIHGEDMEDLRRRAGIDAPLIESHLFAVAGLIRSYEEGGDEALQALGIDPNGEIAAKLHEIVIANQQLADALEKGDPEGEEHSLRGVASDAGRELSRTLHREGVAEDAEITRIKRLAGLDD